MRSIAIPKNILKHWQFDINDKSKIAGVQTRMQALLKGEPDVSIVMPAYNEEESIRQTLSSLSDNITKWSVEVIVVDNNSKDATAALASACGARCVSQTIQGITPARNKGLSEARGKYILNADADSIYPPNWIEEMIKPLAKSETEVALTYGMFSFIPVGKTGRGTYFFYEYMAEFTRWINRTFREEAVNVYGFDSGFRRLQGLEVDSFNHPPGTNEDGFLAMKLRKKGFGKLYCVRDAKALVWTTDRRLQIDGGLWKATKKRLKRMVS